MRKSAFVIISLFVAILSSCTSYTKVLKTGDYNYMYEVGKQEFLAGHYGTSALLMQQVIAVYKGSEKGEESLFLLGMSHYYSNDNAGAVNVLRKLYQTYPRSAYAEEAHFYCGRALYRSAPMPKLDQTDTYEAVTELHAFIEAYPTSQYVSQARDLIFKLQDRLVEKEYLSAKLYYDLGDYFGNCNFGGSNYQACIITAENALKEYPYTTLREDFSFLILKAKFDLAEKSIEAKKEERLHSAIDEYYSFLNEFPESKKMVEAKGMFEKAQRQVKKENNNDNQPNQ